MLGWFLLLASLIFEGLVVTLIFRQALSGAEAFMLIFFHLVASVCLAVGLKDVLKREEGYHNWVVLGFFVSLTIPVIGLMGILVLFLLRSRLLSVATSNLCDEYKKYMSQYARMRTIPAAMHNLPEFVRKGADIEPVVQHIGKEDVTSRMRAARVLGRLGDKASLERLRGLVKDSSPGVRSEAASYISMGHEDFTTSIFQAQKEVASNPNSSEAHRVLANFALEYCESGLLDGQTQTTQSDLAEEEYLKYLEIEPRQAEIYNNLGRISIIRKDFSAGRELFEKALSCEAYNLRAMLGLAQCYYELGQYDRIPPICKRIREKHPHPDRFLDIIDFWTEKPEENNKK